MATVFVGTISVDFAGDMIEAQEYIRSHKDHFPRTLTLGRGGGKERSPNGDFMLWAAFRNRLEMYQVISAFEKLGWDKSSQSNWQGWEKPETAA